MSPRVALVTGAAQGLGRSIAGRLLADGWAVSAADLTPTPIDADESLSCTVDVSSQDDVARYVERTLERFGRVDAVVNNAGIGGPSKAVVDTDPADFVRVLEVNLVGSFLVARAAASVMIGAGRGGRIVNLGSLFGQQGVAGGAAYSASKSGITALTHSLALELAPHGITVNTVAPGNMWTQMHADEVAVRAARANRTPEEEREAIRGSIPLGRHGTGDDIAGAVAWLLSEDAAYVTGQTVSVNGGVYLT
jgi:NAD(P)-dependent dehydrogenase (short-subunit alcohol dehydrogenase family)